MTRWPFHRSLEMGLCLSGPGIGEYYNFHVKPLTRHLSFLWKLPGFPHQKAKTPVTNWIHGKYPAIFLKVIVVFDL